MIPMPSYRYAQRLWLYAHRYPTSTCWSIINTFSFIKSQHLSKVKYHVYSITYSYIDVSTAKEIVSTSEMKKDRELIIEDILE